MKIVIKCPKCGVEIRVVKEIDWLNFNTYLYPVCDKCKWTTKETFYTVAQINEYMKINF